MEWESSLREKLKAEREKLKVENPYCETKFIESMGEQFGVPRLPGEADDDYFKRIKKSSRYKQIMATMNKREAEEFMSELEKL